EIEDISRDDDDKDAEEKASDEQTGDDQGIDNQAEKVKAKESIPEPHVEQSAVTHKNSSQTLSFAEYGNQFIIDNPDVSLTDVLKEPVEAKNQW
ncbi:hypothetical protein Tco_0549812, partial [Tanacetum coccineum]